MAQIQFGKNNRSFEKFYDWFHVGACGIAVVLAAASFLNRENPMGLFPLIFLDAAALNGVQALARFRRGSASAHWLSGVALGALCVILLVLSIVCGKVVWS